MIHFLSSDATFLPSKVMILNRPKPQALLKMISKAPPQQKVELYFQKPKRQVTSKKAPAFFEYILYITNIYIYNTNVSLVVPSLDPNLQPRCLSERCSSCSLRRVQLLRFSGWLGRQMSLLLVGCPMIFSNW